MTLARTTAATRATTTTVVVAAAVTVAADPPATTIVAEATVKSAAAGMAAGIMTGEAVEDTMIGGIRVPCFFFHGLWSAELKIWE